METVVNLNNNHVCLVYCWYQVKLVNQWSCSVSLRFFVELSSLARATTGSWFQMNIRQFLTSSLFDRLENLMPLSQPMREERLKAIMLACTHIPATGASYMYLFRNLIGSMPICSLPIGSLARRWFSYLSLGCKHRMCAGISSLWISPGNFWSCICFSLAYRICRIQYQCILFNLKERTNVF